MSPSFGFAYTFLMLNIIYQDDSIVAIDKPVGLLVHRSRIDVHAKEFALQMLRDQIGQPVFPVHRIDRPTSGVLLFALNSNIARELCVQFENRTVTKTYNAIVRGHPPANGHWDEPLLEKLDPIVDRNAGSNKPPQAAVTEFKTLRSWTVPYSTGKYKTSRYSLVEVHPLTGRKHQIRRHFNHMAYPIIGDSTYGDRRHNRLFREHLGLRRLMLVARQLKLVHPVTQLELSIDATMDGLNNAIECLDGIDMIEKANPTTNVPEHRL